MKPMKPIDALRSLDLADLDLARMAAWSVKTKAALMALLFAAVLAAGHLVVLKGIFQETERLAAAQRSLRQEQAEKTIVAAQLDGLRTQHQAAAAVLADWCRRLPAEAAASALLEDISQAAEQSGLNIEGLELAPEVPGGFYSELPFKVKAAGGYHQIGAFLSAVADLPHLVTLHDFDLRPKRSDHGLQLQISAKTYAYPGDAK